jgi:predicted CoA-substrate-specific enzyme activase
MKEVGTGIGVDIGALFIKVVRLSSTGAVLYSAYFQHKGDPAKAFEEVLLNLRIKDGEAVGVTGSAARLIAATLGVSYLDITRCQIEAVRHLLPEATLIMDIGGGSATLIQLDSHGQFQGYATNSSCAAGTGSFLDEQASRLGISYSDIQGFTSVEDPPSIATRCSVFAKSDLIHRQQEGYSKAAMWSGLCKGMTRTLLATLLNGKPLDGPVAVIGGVAQNREVVRWLRQSAPEYIRVPTAPHLMAAFGAARLAAKPDVHVTRSLIADTVADTEQNRYPWSLSLEKSRFPSFETAESYLDEDQNEIRINTWPESQKVSGCLGIDIGSTSTKLVLMDNQEQVLLDIYRKTSGDPIGATKLLFRALRQITDRRGTQLDIQGVGTTGSGRKLVGKVIGADAIVNEISAHVAGALKTDANIDTIFEIGGQDSKYMYIQDGHICDANMNYVCAAGTGSFVEEQANKLGYPVHKVGEAVLGLCPPHTSDRCTVFMEQDVAQLIQLGFSPEEALAGVMVSVVKNYLNKVVGNRPRSRRRIFFQGATARNPALVAAFERVLGVPMVVSPYCHVMGAYGVALITRRLMQERGQDNSAFRGLDLDRRAISIRSENCRLCQNDCHITFAEIEGIPETPSWGYLCGRDPEETKVRINPREQSLRLRQKLWREAGSGIAVDEHAPVVGIPQALTTYSYLPLWRSFFNHLGFKVELSGTTTLAIREQGTRIGGAEFCFPAKVAIGHVATLANREGVDFIWVPHLVSEVPNKQTTGVKFCPYVQAFPAYARTALDLNGIDISRLLSPVIDLRLSVRRQTGLLFESLAAPLHCTYAQIRQAWQKALTCQREFEQRCQVEGQRIMAEARRKGEKLLVLVGRPYNNYDSGLNLGLPRKLAEYGRTIIPLEFLGANLKRLGKRYKNSYWNYGQRILSGLEQIAASDWLDAVYLTNFNCGPDSFLLSYAHEILGNRPFLSLELDEHGADAGYLTRVEAFFDVLRRPGTTPKARRPYRPEPDNLKDRIIWLPPMHPLGTPFLAAAFRRHGFDGRPLPPEDQEAFELGRSVTRGAECLPTSLTIGALLQALRGHQHGDQHAFFMPTAEGPCRFGQYCLLHRQVLDRMGYSDVAIISPSSFNSYQGLKEPLRRDLWKATLASDILYKAVLKVRPYERDPGTTNRVLDEEQRQLEERIAAGSDIRAALGRALRHMESIPRRHEPKPLVGVVGEIYVRCNSFANEDVIGAIERFGGEAWLVPMSEWILYTTAIQGISFKDRSRNFVKRWVALLKNRYIMNQEKHFMATAGDLLADRHEPPIAEVLDNGAKFFPINFEGEAILTVGRTVSFARQGAALVVNCAPFGCMPGTISTALFRQLSTQLGIPLVNLFYDGQGNQNARLEVFLSNAIQKMRAARISLPGVQQPTAKHVAA